MKKLSIDNIFKKLQYLSILNALYKYPEGLTLHEITYLLSTKKNMQKMRILHNRFNPNCPLEITENRKDIFKGKIPRSRIHRCLTELLRNFGLIEKIDKNYKLVKQTSELFFLILNINYLNFLFDRSKTTKFVFETWKKQQPMTNSFNIDKVDTNFTSILLTPDIQIYGSIFSLKNKDKKKMDQIVRNMLNNFEDLKKLTSNNGNFNIIMNTKISEVQNLSIPPIHYI